MSTASDNVEQRPPILTKNVSFHLLWSSTLASGFGDRLAALSALAMLGYVDEGTDKASISSAIEFFFFLPYLLWSPIAGWLSDRYPRRWLMFIADETRGIFILLMLVVMTGLTGSDGTIAVADRWILWTLIFLIGVMAATFVPAKLSIVPNVVGNKLLTRANAAVTSTGIIGNLMGFLIGGALVENHVRGTIALAAGCYMVSGVFWLFVRTPFHAEIKQKQVTTPMKVLHDIRAGFHYALRHRPVLILIIAAGILWGGTAVYKPVAAYIAVSPEMYGGTEQTYGITMATLGFGMLLSAVIMGIFNPRIGGELIMSFGMIFAGLFMGAQMFIPHMPTGMMMGFGLGLAGGVILVALNTMVQRITPNYMRGRVFAAKEMLLEVGNVGIAFTIWRIPDADAIILNVTIVYAVFFILVGVVGIYFFVLREPFDDPKANFFWRGFRLFTHTWHNLQITGKHHVPHDGGVLLVSNHTTGLDPSIIQSAMIRRVRFIMAKEYMAKPLNFFWRLIRPIPVERNGRDTTALRETVEALKSGDVVCVFPEGSINHDRERLRPFKPGTSLMAGRADVPIVPVFIEGTPRTKSIVGSLLRPSKSRITFGKPFRPDRKLDRDAQVAQIQAAVEALRPRKSE